MLVALAGAGEWQKGHVAGTLDGDGEGALVLGAGAHLAARLDLAAFADVTPEPGQVLVVNVLDVVHGELGDLASRGVASAAGATARTTTWTARPAAFAFAALTLRATEARSTAFAFATLALWAAEARAAGATFAFRARRPLISILGVIRHDS
jgi:hypothetical protein